MAASTKKSKSGGASKDLKQEDILQALVIADNFDCTKFDPITQCQPKALVPLVNVPLLDYTLHALAHSGVHEIIIFCSAHANLILQHLNDHGWMKHRSVTVIPLVLENCLNLWQVIHEVDVRNLIRSDFILLDAFTPTNINFKPLLQAHKQRGKETSGAAVMTLLVQQSRPGHVRRAPQDQLMLALEADRLLQLQRIVPGDDGGEEDGEDGRGGFQLLLEVLSEHPACEVRHDLVDCHVALCSAQVPPLFTENYDFFSVDDFVKGIIMNEEILGNTIHVHVLESGYASSVADPRQYCSVSMDVLQGRLFPLTPDIGMRRLAGPRSDSYCRRGQHNVFLGTGVTLSRGSRLEQDVLLAEGTSVGEDTTLASCVVGKHCTIGKRSKLKNCYLWDGACVGDDVTMDTCILSYNAKVLDKVNVGVGFIATEKAVVGPDVRLGENVRVTCTPLDGDEGEFSDPEDESLADKKKIDTSLLGSQAQAYVYEKSENMRQSWRGVSEEAWQADSGSEDSLSGSEDGSEGSDAGEEAEDGLANVSPEGKGFFLEVIGLIKDVKEGTVSPSNAVVEINSLKSAHALNINEVNHLLVMVLVCEAQWDHSEEGSGPWLDPLVPPQSWLQATVKLFSKALPVIRNYIKSAESQEDCLLALEDVCSELPSFSGILSKLLNWMYQKDIVGEEVVLQWYKQPDRSADVKQHLSSFITWLEEAEEETESDDE